MPEKTNIGAWLSGFLAQPLAMLPEAAAALARLQTLPEGTAKAEHVAGALRLASNGPALIPGGVAVNAMGDGGGKARALYQRVGTVAVVDVWGVLDRTESDVTAWGERYGTAYETIQQAVEAAMADEGVASVLLRVDSPGGAAMPIEPVAARLHALGGRDAAAKGGKPMVAFSDSGYTASAALYIAAQASAFFVAPGSWNGSIGTIRMHADYSKMLDEVGITVTAIKSNAEKDTGSPYRPLAEADRARLQDSVSVYAEQFKAALARGFGVSAETVNKWQSDWGYIGAAAVKAGMADGVRGTVMDVISEMQQKYGARVVRKPGMGQNGTTALVGGANQGVISMEPENKNGGQNAPAPNGANPAGGGGGAPAATVTQPVAGGDGGPDRMKIETARAAVNASIIAKANLFPGNAAVAKLKDEAVANNWSAETFGEKALSAIAAERAPSGHVPGGGVQQGIQVGATQRQKRGAAIAGVLLHRIAGSRIENALNRRVEGASAEERDRRGATILAEMGFDDDAAARRFVNANFDGMRSVRLRELVRMHVADCDGTSLEQTYQQYGSDQDLFARGFRAEGALGSSDFPKLFMDAAHKSLLGQYKEPVLVWDAICRVGDNIDFKPRNLLRISEAPDMEKILEGAKPKQATFNERGTTVVVETFGAALQMTLKMMVNDDLGAFTQALGLIGAAGSRIPENLFFAQLALNSNRGPTDPNDAKALFHTDHSNIATAAALSYAAAQAAVVLMAGQKGIGASLAPIDIAPTVLLVPTALMFTAKDLAIQEYAPGSTGAQLQKNVLRSTFEVRSSPRISGTRWWMFHNSIQAAAFEMAFLNGQRTPTITEVSDGSILAKQYEVIIPGAGIGLVDNVAAVVNDGA